MFNTPVSRFVFFVAHFLATVVTAQSSIIGAGGEARSSNSTLGASFALDSLDRVPNSLNSIQRSYDSILLRTAPSIDDRPQTTANLLKKLRLLGLPTSLHDSAEGDVDEKTEIAIPFPELPLITRMQRGLARHNCQLEIVGDEVLILSMDVVGDPECFLTVSYDISRMPFNSLELINTIQSSLATDNWSDTGTGDQTIVILSSGSRRTLVVGSPYTFHLQLREFFDGLRLINALDSMPDRIARSELPQGRSSPMMHSRVVQVPNSGVERRGITRPDSGNQGGFGGGGRAGGVFRIGN